MSSRSETEQPAGLTSAALRVYLLGPPCVEWEATPFPSPAARPATSSTVRQAGCNPSPASSSVRRNWFFYEEAALL